MKPDNGETTTLELEVVQPTALEAIERAQVDMQISTARRFPRSLTVVKKRMMDLATLDQETAESCFYKLNRAGRAIEGPSIRLAEIAASSFGNLRYGARVIGNDGKVIVAQGYCHDLETNVMSQVEVRRRITDRNGQTYSDDMQVVTGNAACAIAMRNAMFKIVPFAFVKPIFTAAKQAAVGDIKTLAERRTAMLKKFAAMGVDEKRVCGAVNVGGIEEIGLDQLETLIGLHNAVRDNEQTVDEAFPLPISKPTISSPPATTTDDTKKKRGRKKDDAAPQTGPNLTEMEARLKLGGFTAVDLLQVAIENKWVDAPAGYTGTRLELANVPLASVGEEKLGVFLESNTWNVIMEKLEALEK